MEKQEKYVFEYPIHCSIPMLYDYISDSTKLSLWFADKVTLKNNLYTFVWEHDDTKEAKLVASHINKSVRFRWIEDERHTYFEILLKKDELTGDTAIVVTDFANKNEIEDRIAVWIIQLDRLRDLVGAHE